jgi:ketosteroid isomerase-like protein
MEAVWGPAGRILCVHPGRPPLAGRRAVMQSWADILGATGGVRIRFECHDRVQAGSLAVHTGLEIIGDPDEDPSLVAVTNVYELTETGWKMRLHHAGPIHGSTVRSGPLH